MTDPFTRQRIAPSDPESGSIGAPSASASPAADDVVDLAQLWQALVDHRWFVLAVGLAVFVPVVGMTLRAWPAFTATGRLYLGELNSTTGGKQVDLAGNEQIDLGSEIDILQSRPLIKRAILASGANVELRPTGWERPRFWKWLTSERDITILDIGIKQVRAVDTFLAEGSLEPVSYTIRFSSQTEYELLDDDGSVLANAKLNDVLRHGNLQLRLIPGTETLPEPGSSYSLYVDLLEDAADYATSHITASSTNAKSESAKIVSIEVTDLSPYVAATFLRSLMEAYLAERQAWKTENATAVQDFITRQLRSMRESLDETGQRLADYRSGSRVVTMDTEAKAIVEQVGKYEEQRVSARLELATLQDLRRALASNNGSAEAYLVGEIRDTVLHELGVALMRTQKELNDIRARYQDSSPNVQTLRNAFESQLAVIRSYVDTRVARAEEHHASLSRVIGEYEARLRSVPGAELGLQQLARESDVYSRLFSYLLEQQQQAAIVKASTISKNRILEPPEYPRWEAAPNLNLRLASGLVGLVLGAILVILRRFFSSNLQSSEEVRRVVAGRPVLTSVPQLAEKNRFRHGDFLVWLETMLLDPIGSYAEAFRTLRSNLTFFSPGPVLLWTSAKAGEGKTLTAFSFAASMAANGKHVLLIDADLRKPSHHDFLGHGNDFGLRRILSGQQHWRDNVLTLQFRTGVLSCIPAGPAAPSELLSSERMSRFMAEVRSNFDCIVIDAPCYPQVSDATVLARHADGLLSVVRLGHTPRKIFAEHLEAVSRCARPHAIIINGGPQVSPYGVQLDWRERLKRHIQDAYGLLARRPWLVVGSALLVVFCAFGAVRVIAKQQDMRAARVEHANEVLQRRIEETREAQEAAAAKAQATTADIGTPQAAAPVGGSASRSEQSGPRAAEPGSATPSKQPPPSKPGSTSYRGRSSATHLPSATEPSREPGWTWAPGRAWSTDDKEQNSPALDTHGGSAGQGSGEGSASGRSRDVAPELPENPF